MAERPRFPSTAGTSPRPRRREADLSVLLPFRVNPHWFEAYWYSPGPEPRLLIFATLVHRLVAGATAACGQLAARIARYTREHPRPGLFGRHLR